MLECLCSLLAPLVCVIFSCVKSFNGVIILSLPLTFNALIAMYKRGLCRRVVSCWVSGWLAVTFVYCVETAKDTAVVATECEQETVPKLSNGTIFNDLERP